MEQNLMVLKTQPKVFYKVAGVMAILIVFAALSDVITSIGVAAQDNRIIQIAEWFKLFQTNSFQAFSRLGVINIVTLSLGIPIYLAFNQVFSKDRPALAAFASILFFIGSAVYLSSNTVFAQFALSQQYAIATTAQRPLLEAAGFSLLSQGADLTPGTFIGLFLTQIAGLVITSAMLRKSVFGKWTGWAGLAGFSFMSVFFILAAFFPEHYTTAMMLAMPGGLILMAYHIMLARKFFLIGR